MIELPIPAEITKYEAKLVGPLTTRQACCAIPVAIIAMTVWNTFKSTVPANTLYTVIILIAIPFAVIGWWKPYDMHAEQFLLAILFNTILSPSKRIFASNNYVPGIEKNISRIKKTSSDRKEQKKMQKQMQKDTKKKKKAVKQYKKQMFA